MNKKVKLAITITCAIISSIFLTSLNVYGTYEVKVPNLPKDIVSGKVEYLDKEWNAADTNAVVSIKSESATVSSLSDSGYYTVTFFSETKELGKSEFFLGDSGKLYSYTYELKDDEYSPVYTSVDSAKYEAYGYGRILDISGKNNVIIKDVPDEVKKANVYVSCDNGDYGERNENILAKDGVFTLSLGTAGSYIINFFGSDDNALGMTEFILDEKGTIYTEDYVYNESNGEWENLKVKSDCVYYSSYDEYGDFGTTEDEAALLSVSVSNVPKTVESVDVQYLNESMEQSDAFADVKIPGDGTVSISDLYGGYYTLNFYDVSYNCVGYSTFYLNNDGDIFTFDKSTKINEPKFAVVEPNKSYTYGKMSVSIYGISEDIDSVDVYYYYGNELDEAIPFEAEMSSISAEPMVISNLGMEGKYKLNFYIDGSVVGNAEFYLDKTGKTFEYDYQYNEISGEWEEKLIEASNIYYYDNTDVEDSDSYEYGNVKFTITNVPTNVKYAEVRYYDNDDTFTADTLIFPEIAVDGKGTVSINNLGQQGYYEIELLSSDGKTRVGYAFINIDKDLNTYYIEKSINPDTSQIETVKTKANQIPLKEYLGGTIEYSKGNNSVTVYDIPSTINKMLLTCVAPDGKYASYEEKIAVTSDGKAVIDKLGMEGDYTISFFTDKEYVGTASFYMNEKGELYKAAYSYDEKNGISIDLTDLSKVLFIKNNDAVSYEIGDIDFSGTIDIADAVILKMYLVGAQPLSASQFNNSDLNSDGVINVFDFIKLKRIIMGI